MNFSSAAHNPEVVGSNPSPRNHKIPISKEIGAFHQLVKKVRGELF